MQNESKAAMTLERDKGAQQGFTLVPRDYLAAAAREIGPEVAEALRVLKEDVALHKKWADWQEANPGWRSIVVPDHVGATDHHRKWQDAYSKVVNVIERLASMASAKIVDAARYRWLRTTPNNLRQELYCGPPAGLLLKRDEHLDAAIDALMAAEYPETHPHCGHSEDQP